MAKEYITKEGERWDMIAYRFYGNPNLYPEILRANPDVEAIPLTPGGLRLVIPDVEVPIDTEDLPPWKR